MNDPGLTIEIHDVAPATFDEVRVIRTALDGLGVHRPSLLVVPRMVDDEGTSWDLRDYASVVDWLASEQSGGSEIIQHGLTHRAPGPPPPGFANSFMHHVFSRGRAEFAHLTATEAQARLEAGRCILEECGLHTPGFIAPAWQQSPPALDCLGRLRYAFTAFFNKILPLTGDRRSIPTPVLTFDAPCRAAAEAKRLFMLGVEHLSRKAPLVRVALHPADVHVDGLLAHILDRVRKLMLRRRPTSYARWLA